MPTPENRAGWRKSSYSDTGNGCVEVFRTLEAIRDSKQTDGPELAVNARALVRTLQSGRLAVTA